MACPDLSRPSARRRAPVRAAAVLTAALACAAVAPDVGMAAAAAHPPIVIQHDSDFSSCRCVTSGAGTQASPYVIGPWAINNAAGTAVLIDGASLTKSFVLSNVTVAGNGAQTARGIVLRNINASGGQGIAAAVRGTSTSVQHTGVGITVDGSSYVTLDGGGANPNGPGISPAGAGRVNKNRDGAIDVERSSHITVRGWQLSANGSDNDPDWVGLDPGVTHWGIGGVRFFSVTDSTIDHMAANNDTDISYALFASSRDALTASTANYPFTSNVMVADGSAFDTVSGNDLATADFIGILVADPLPGSPALAQYGATHDVTVQGNYDHSDGPTGTELTAGIAPAFLGGIVVLNGTYDNSILSNRVHSAGGGLVWAQAVPDPSSAIGVRAAPPLLHCNVTASEGGGGVANHNGNVWIGNQATSDPCVPG